MASDISATYALRRFTRSREPDLKTALEIYKQNIPPGSRTDTEQITYWIENYREHYPDELCVCGLYVDNMVVGMTEFAYFKAERLLAFDYLVLHPGYRNHGECYQFKKMILQWINDHGFEFDFATAEVNCESAGGLPSENSKALVELFMWLGFSVVDCVYYQPALGLQNPQSDTRAFLMLSSHVKVPTIAKGMLLNIVRTLYWQHNERWFVPFVSDRKAYHELLVTRFRQLEKHIARKSEIALNGLKTAPEPPPLTPIKAKGKRDLFGPGIATMIVSGQCIGLVLLQYFFHLSTDVLVTIVLLALIEFVALFALFSKRAKSVLDALIEIVRLLYKKK